LLSPFIDAAAPRFAIRHADFFFAPSFRFFLQFFDDGFFACRCLYCAGQPMFSPPPPDDAAPLVTDFRRDGAIACRAAAAEAPPFRFIFTPLRPPAFAAVR
jgi:hypothetical protein